MAEENKNGSVDNVEENKNVEDQDNENEPGDGSEDKGGNGSSTADSGKNGKTFSQSQVNKMMAKEKNQGRNSAYKELGIDPKDSKMVAMVKALIESQKSDEQKKEEAAKENQDKVNEAERRATIAEAKAEAMTLGVKSQFVDDIVTLVLAKATEDSDLKTIIGEFKTKYPAWFGEEEKDGNDAKKKKGQSGTGSSIKTKEDKNGSDKGIGARLAAQKKASSNKSSYWGKK